MSDATQKWRAEYRNDQTGEPGWFTLDEIRGGTFSIVADFGQAEEACELAARAMNVHDDLTGALLDALDALKAWEQWEADIIMDGACWPDDLDGCVIGGDHLDAMTPVQQMRNAAMKRAVAAIEAGLSGHPAPAAGV